MSQAYWLLLLLLAVSWITTSCLGNEHGFSTRKPGTWDYEDDDDTNDHDDDDENAEDDDEPELLISSVLVRPYLEKGKGDGEEFVGVIPDLLEAICQTGHMTCDYQIELAADGLFGSRDNQGHWTGMIGEVKRGEVDFAAAPIKVSAERMTVVNFSIPFAETALTVIVNEADGVRSIEDILTKNITLGGVSGGGPLEKLRNQPKAPYSTMWAAIESQEDAKVSSNAEGVERVLAGGYAFVCETDMARYYISHHCSIKKIDEDFLHDKGHAFAFPKEDEDQLENHVNMAIKSLKDEGKIEQIYDKWFSATCGASSVQVINSALLFALLCLVLL